MFVVFDIITKEPYILRCTEDDGEVRVALTAAETIEALHAVIDRVYGKGWHGRFEYHRADAAGIARRRGIHWFYGGGDTCVPVERA